MEPVHDFRVAALRVNFALKFFKKFLDASHTNMLRHKFARARHVMAQRRDWDIFSSRIKKDFQVINTPSSLKEKILETIKVREAKAHRNLVRMLRSYQYKSMLRDLEQTASTETKKKFKFQNLFKRLLKRLSFAKTPQMSRQGLGGGGWGPQQRALSPYQLHKVRIAFKHLRYTCEFLAVFYDGKKIQEVICDIVNIQDVLGEHQDAENTVRMLNYLKIAGNREGIGKLIGIEKHYAAQARKKFTKIYRSKRYRILMKNFLIEV